MKSKWIKVNEDLPNNMETVWCYSDKHNRAFIGCYGYLDNEGWFWAESNGTMYIEDGKIVAECEMDDLHVSHWMPLPKTPK